MSKAPVWSLKLPWCRSKVTCSRSLLQNSLPYFRVRKFEACEASLSKQFLVTPIQHTLFYTLVQCTPPQQGLAQPPTPILLVNLVVGVFTSTSISSWHHGGRPTVCRISRGDAGIEEVTQSLCDVDVAAARAFDPRDEQKVKTTIQSTVP